MVSTLRQRTAPGRRMAGRSGLVIALMAGVSACGGGSPPESAGITVVPAASAVAITPTPAPTPTPTPEPAATPTPTAAADTAVTPVSLPAGATCRPQVGVNLAGGEFGNIGDKYAWGYIYPSAKTLDYFAGKNMTLIRLPIRWERVQSAPFAALNDAEMDRIAAVARAAADRGMTVIIDVHNYGRFNADALGSAALSVDALADLWKRMATRFAGVSGIGGYDLMNEPHNMPTTSAWPIAAQRAVNAIRTVDMRTRIYVEGDGWSSASGWEDVNGKLAIVDPANNFRYEAHQYFDGGSGKYAKSAKDQGATPAAARQLLKPFLTFLARTKSKGLIGEVGIPTADADYLPILDAFMDEATSNGLAVTYWAAGEWWQNYALSIQPNGAADKPQWSVLSRYVTRNNSCT